MAKYAELQRGKNKIINPGLINEKGALWKIHALMTFAMVLVATSFIVMARIANEMDSSVLTLLRFCLAFILLSPFLKYCNFESPTPAAILRYSILGGFQAIYFTSMFEALRYTSSLHTAVLFTLVPLLSAGIAFFFLRERLSTRVTFGLFCAFTGALYVITEGNIGNLLRLNLNKGDAIFLVSVASFGIYGPLINYLHRDEPMLVMTFWTVVTGSFWLILFTNFRIIEVDWSNTPSHVYWWISYLAIFTTIVTFFITQFCSIKIGPTKMMAYIYLVPSFVLLINWLIGERTVTRHMIIGVSLTLVASLIIQWNNSRNTVNPAKTTI